MAKTLFVTPDYTSEVTQCRTLRTPNNAEWLGVFNKALLTMLDPYNWEQINDTDLTVEETIDLAQAMINEFWTTEDCGTACSLPDLDTPPFRLGLDGRFEMLDPVTGEWTTPYGEYEIPPTPAREEATELDRRCAAAANAANVMEILYEAITDEIALGGDALQVAAALVAALVTAVGGWIAAPVYAIIQLTIALFAGMIELLQALGADVWTGDFTDKLKCALFDCATDTGDVVTFELDCIRENLAVVPDIFNPTIFYEYQLFAQVLYLMEVITMDGLNAAGATTDITDANCECGACVNYEDDFTDGLGAQTSLVTGWGDWNSGNGHDAVGCIASTVGAGYRDAGCEIDLLHECRVSQVSAWGRSANNAGAWGMYVYYYDDTHTEIGNVASSLVGSSQATWTLKATTTAVDDVRYVRVLIQTNGGNRAYEDEIQITVE